MLKNNYGYFAVSTFIFAILLMLIVEESDGMYGQGMGYGGGLPIGSSGMMLNQAGLPVQSTMVESVQYGSAGLPYQGGFPMNPAIGMGGYPMGTVPIREKIKSLDIVTNVPIETAMMLEHHHHHHSRSIGKAFTHAARKNIGKFLRSAGKRISRRHTIF